MVLGIVGLVALTCGWVLLQIPSIVMGILAIVFGKQAQRDIAERPELEGGPQATAGFVMGIITVSLAAVTFLVLIIANA